MSTPAPTAVNVLETLKIAIDKGEYKPLDTLKSDQFAGDVLTQAFTYASSKSRVVSLMAHIVASGISYEIVDGSIRIGSALFDAKEFLLIGKFLGYVKDYAGVDESMFEATKIHTKSAFHAGTPCEAADLFLKLLAMNANIRRSVQVADRKAKATQSANTSSGTNFNIEKVDLAAALLAALKPLSK
jgi:hypothetical protein